MEYELVLGVEIHIQLKTSRKMFCTCPNDPFDSVPNTNVCPVCLGLPGAMPVPNKEALQTAQKLAYALGSALQKNVVFERKNYFYPDLPKGFQLTCPHFPIAVGGSYDLGYFQKGATVRYREIHVEEDTAKSLHKNGETFVDCNKSGIPLLEIVTEPDFHDIDLAVQFCKEVQRVARALGASDADMEKGHMRLEANISVREQGARDLPGYRVELKNINSFMFMKKALHYEFERQQKALSEGQTLSQETRGFNPDKNETFTQRTKEEAHDYRYFPEPDIPEISCDDAWLSSIQKDVDGTTLPQEKREELMRNDIPNVSVDILVEDEQLFKTFHDLLKLGYEPRKAANLLINTPAYRTKSARDIDALENEKNAGQITSDDDLSTFIHQVIREQPKAVEDFRGGNSNSLQFLIGQVMQKTKGKADAKKVAQLLSASLH